MNLTAMTSKIAKYFSAPFGRGDYLLAFILAILVLIICAFKLTEYFRMFDDSAAYVSQGISIAQGEVAQYMSENALMTSKQDLLYMTPTAYPWGFSLLLAPLYQIFGFNIIAFKSVGVICYALFVGIFYMFCAKRLPRIYAIFATLLFAINPFLTYFSANEIMSDIPFLLFGFVALIILAKLFSESVNSSSIAEGDKGGGLNTQKISGAKIVNIESTHPLTPSAREGKQRVISTMGGGRIYAILGGIFMLFSTMIRINGFVILCALIAMHGIILLKRFTPKIFQMRILKPFAKVDSPYPPQIHAIPYAIFIVGFAITSITLSSGTARHADYLTMINLQTMLNNIKAINFAWFIGLESGVDSALLWLCMPFIALGIYANLRKNAKSSATIFYVIFMLGFFTLLLLWVAFEKRFVFLLLPFLVLWCFKGFAFIKQKIFSYFIVALLVLILVNCVWINARDISFIKTDSNPDNAYNAEAKELYKFIIDNTPKNAIIISFKPRILYLNTHRLGFVSPDIERVDEADFVLWNGKYMMDLHTMQDISSPTFQAKTELIFENAEYKLFKVLK